MKDTRKKISNKTLALFAAAVILLGSGGVMSARAALNTFSPKGDATLATSSVQVQLLENGTEAGSQDDLSGAENKLFTSLTGTLVPGKEYPADSVTIKNSGSADEYVRVIVRKYWADAAGSNAGSSNTSAQAGKKNKGLKPSYIELTPVEGWTEVDEGGEETTAYYYTKPLKPGDGEVPLFDTIRISDKVIDDSEKVEETVTEETGKVKVITYTYKYEDKVFTVEAEAQSVQASNADAAIKSVWGVTASFDADGNITSISR